MILNIKEWKKSIIIWNGTELNFENDKIQDREQQCIKLDRIDLILNYEVL